MRSDFSSSTGETLPTFGGVRVRDDSVRSAESSLLEYLLIYSIKRIVFAAPRIQMFPLCAA